LPDKNAHNGSDDFGFIHDASGDIQNYSKLSSIGRAVFARMLRKYYHDDPNAAFEYANFTARRRYQCFYDVSFDEAETEGFTAAFGRPSKNAKRPYAALFGRF
jgi:hypothetical protein